MFENGEKLVTLKEAENFMRNAVALYMNKPNVLLYGKKTYLTKERDVCPLVQGKNAMLPVEFFLNSIGEDEKSRANQETLQELAQGTVQVVQVVNGILYESAMELCNAYGYYLFFDESGLLIYSKENLQLSWKKNLELLRRIAELFIYDDVTGAEIVARVKELHPDRHHPRLLMTEAHFKNIRKEITDDKSGNVVYKAIFESVKKEADSYLQLPSSSYEIEDGIRLLPVSRQVSKRILVLAMMFQLTGEEKYAVRCRQEMRAAADFQDWHPYHFLDTAEMTNGMAIGYDWLYQWLGEEDRAYFRNAIFSKGIRQIMNDYAEVTIKDSDQSNPLSRTWFWRGRPVDNWRVVCSGGIALGALAVCDEANESKLAEDEYVGSELAMCERVLGQSLLDIREMISLFAPDGGYEEGIVYWGFACKYYCYFMKSLMTAVGQDFGYSDAPGLRKTNEYVCAVNGPVGIFSYHDCDTIAPQLEPYMLFWANRFGHPESAKPRIAKILKGEGNVHDFIYYDAACYEAVYHGNVSEASCSFEFVRDTMLNTIGIFASRSSWEEESLYVGFHADEAYAGPSHDHNDGGSFVLQAMGENFFVDLGKDNYNLPNYYGNAYRTRAEGHNTIVINPDGRRWDQTFGGWSEIKEFRSAEQGAYAIADLTDLYRDYVESAWRGVKLDDNRSRVTVQDEIVMKEPSEIYWFAHTRANIEIVEDGRKAYLELNGKRLLAEIVTEKTAAEESAVRGQVLFSVMAAKPLPGSPDPVGQLENIGYRKLTIHVKNVQKLKMAVVFTPCDVKKRNNSYEGAYIPLREWSM